MTTDELLDQANLRYTTDTSPGLTRKKHGDQFDYFGSNDEKISDPSIIERINNLAIPPAWKDVWICKYKNGHLQATGLDDKGRKQYRYHPLWTDISQQKKFERMMLFSEVLPKIRQHINKVLDQPGHTREKVLATIVWLLENTLIRVGNEEYEKDNKSYGLTTLKNRHVNTSQDQIHFSFKGKSGVYHNVHTKSKKVAKVIKQCQDLPGQDLFEYRDESANMQYIYSQDVNDYLKEISGQDITAKDFRTWAGTTLAAKMIDKQSPSQTNTQNKKTISSIVKDVSKHLRNLPTTCKKYYIHPAVFEAFRKGYTLSNLHTHKKFKSLSANKNLYQHEIGVVTLLSLFAA